MTVQVGLNVSGSACKWRYRVQLSVRNFRWMQPLQVLGVTAGGDQLLAVTAVAAVTKRDCLMSLAPTVFRQNLQVRLVAEGLWHGL